MQTKHGQNNQISLSYANLCSVKNKATSIYDYIIERELDIMVIAETWLLPTCELNAVYLNELLPNDYTISHIPRTDGRTGGGIGIIFRKSFNLTIKRSSHNRQTQFEYLDCVISHGKDHRSQFRLIVVYRPPPTKVNKLRLSRFWNDWVAFLEPLASLTVDLCIVGDLNFHLEDPSEPSTVRFQKILEEVDLVQHITSPTHTAGHILDVLITRKQTEFQTSSLVVHDPGFTNDNGIATTCYHFTISWSLLHTKPKITRKSFTFRKLESVDKQAFSKDLLELQLSTQLSTLTDTDSMVEVFNNSVLSVLDKHAPLISRSVTVRPDTTWYTYDIQEQKRRKRQLERKYVETKLEVHRLAYRHFCAAYNKELRRKRIQCTAKQIAECEKDKSKLFKACKSLIGLSSKDKIPLSGCNTDMEIAQTFSNFFHQKVKLIHQSLNTEAANLPDSTSPSSFSYNSRLPQLNQTRPVPTFSNFQQVTPNEIQMLINKSKSKTCSLDKVPTKVYKMFPEELALPISYIVNHSLESATVPQCFKEALVTPVIKGFDLDPTQPCNYRPISNLPFLSKILEKAVYLRLEDHLTTNKLLPHTQSAYRKGHSAETALLRVNNDILSALSLGKSTLLVTLDISAAFDTIEHQTLLKRYKEYFGISGTVLKWMTSYLADRRQTVQIGKEKSLPAVVECGFPQGSTLGGPKFNMAAAPVPHLINMHGINDQCFADDTNAYIAFDIKDNSDTITAIEKIQECLADVKRWMLDNKLKLNASKTKVVLFSPRRLNSFNLPIPIVFGGKDLPVLKQIKSLGVIFDREMNMQKQVNATISSANSHLYRISKIRNKVSKNVAASLVNALVISRLDYCNSLICNLPKKLVYKMQKVQNSAAKLILLGKKRDHVTPLLKQLHWLPISYRSEYKILVLTYKVLNETAPAYLSELISKHVPCRSLRSANENLLKRPRIPPNKYSERTFSQLAPSLWNGLPTDIRKTDTLTAFKTKLKSHFFILHYDSHT